VSRRGGIDLERILLLILLGMVALSIVRYVGYRRRFPRPIQVGNLVIEEVDREAAQQRLREVFSQPVILRCLNQEVSLNPRDVSFRLFPERMLDAVWDDRSVQLDPADFLAVMLGGDSRPLPVPVAADYDPQALWQILRTVASRCDRPARPPRLVRSELRFTPAEPSQRLDIEASVPQVVGALLSPLQRQVDLKVIQGDEPSSWRDMDPLQEALQDIVSDFPGVAGIFVKDLATGGELAIHGEVTFSGVSLLKVAIAEEFLRHAGGAPSVEAYGLLTETMTLSDNYASNLLLAEIGGGDPYEGARRLTESMQRVGLVNTFMASPYYNGGGASPHVTTPANTRTGIRVESDPYIQTTPRDIGVLLEMIYQGAKGGGTLIAAYPNDITPAECQAILELMKSNRVGSLLEGGVPEGMPIAHKHGWIDDTWADAGIVFSPGGDYVLVVFLYQQGWLPWEQSAPLIADIAHVTYNYFNMDRQW